MNEEFEEEEVVEAKEVKNKKKFPKFIIVLIIILILLVGISVAFFLYNENEKEKIKETYDCLTETTDLLDEIADTIYDYWYDSIYKGKYLGSIDYALIRASDVNKSKNAKVMENNEKLANAVSELNNSNYKKIHRDTFDAIMDAYDSYKEYYEFTINVSGSFKTYSEDKENKKKEVRSYLSKLERKL